MDWVGVDGRLTGPFIFFIAVFWLVQGREEEIFYNICRVVVVVYLRYFRIIYMNTIIEREGN